MTSVVIIDDHALLAEVVAAGLRSHDYDVGILPITDDLLSLLPASDVALVDLELGHAGFSGADLIVPPNRSS